MAITSGSAWLAGTGLGGRGYDPNRGQLLTMSATYVPPAPTSTYVSVPTNPVVSGLEPQQYEAILYGKDIPLFVGGKMLIGGRICEGPFFGGTQADPTVSFIAYHAQNLIGELFSDTVITSGRLRGQEVWNSTSGYIATDKLPSGGLAWNPGHQTNVAFPQSVARYGASAVAYTHGIVSSWENIPLKPFGGIVPFPSVLVENSSYGDPDDGITRTQAITNILRHMRLHDFEYEVDVSGSDPAWMVGASITLEDFLRQLRAIFPNYRITHTDTLRIIEPDEFVLDAEITNSNVQRGTLKFKRTDPLLIPREKRYTFINVERDYEMDVAVAKEDRYPIPTTDASSSTSIELPIATTAAQAVADVHNSLYEELSVRSQMEGVVDRTLFGMQVGDGARFAGSPINMIARVMETVHDFENWSVQFAAGEVINCALAVEPEVDFVACFADTTTSATTITFPDADLGMADPNRTIVVAIELTMVNIGETITGVTINGIPATQAAVASNSSQGAIAAVWHALVTSGATGDVVVNTSGTLFQTAIHVFRIVSAAFAVFDTDDAEATTASAVTVTLDVPANGIAIASGICRQGAGFDWTGATVACTFITKQSAMFEAEEAESAHVISIDPTSIDRVALSAASFTV